MADKNIAPPGNKEPFSQVPEFLPEYSDCLSGLAAGEVCDDDAFRFFGGEFPAYCHPHESASTENQYRFTLYVHTWCGGSSNFPRVPGDHAFSATTAVPYERTSVTPGEISF